MRPFRAAMRGSVLAMFCRDPATSSSAAIRQLRPRLPSMTPVSCTPSPRVRAASRKGTVLLNCLAMRHALVVASLWRYVDVHEDNLDEAQMATWVKQAAALPGWR